MIIIYLTCVNEGEAKRITDSLLDKKLVACAKKIPIESTFWWEGKKDKADEVLVMFETVEEKFEEIEKEVVSLHSYDTPMLFALSVVKTTRSVEKWLGEVLK
jgi:uncharacterized protein involved in tolerance to divalent cations